MDEEEKDPLYEGLELRVQFDKRGGKIPVVLRNSSNGVILGLDYADEASLRETLRTREWSPGTGEAPALSFPLDEILLDCDQDAAVYNFADTSASDLRDFMDIEDVNYDGEGNVPVVVQEIDTNEVLMLAYAKRESLEKARETGKATFFSTSRGNEWVKGETSGNYLHLKRMLMHPDGSMIVYIVEMAGEGACHTETQEGKVRKSCFYRRAVDDGKLEFLDGMK